jgi:serine/threonine protein kinase
MSEKKSRTEKLNIDSATERIEINEGVKPSPGSFTGSLKSGVSIKGYVVEKMISANTGEAEIYLAKKGNDPAIIKYYHPQFKPKEDIVKKFHNIDHPDIITLYEYGMIRGRFCEIMEYAAGGTLSDRNVDGTYKYLPMSEGKVKQIIDETINAFKFLHKEGIIHRDIKPGNLFYKNANGSDLLIGDFGISSELDVDGGMSKRMTSTLALSEGYAAPELYGIAKDDNKAKILIGPEVDYYALGITVYELLTATNPFAGRNALHIMRDTIEGRVADDLLTRPEAKQLSPVMNCLIKGLLTVRHDKRWGYSEVSRWLKGESVKVYREQTQRSLPVIKFGDESISTIEELTSAVNTNRELGKKYLMRGFFDQWAVKFDESLANDIIDIKELDVHDDDKLLILIFKLNPSLPCVIDNNIIISNINDLIDLIRKDVNLSVNLIAKRIKSDLFSWVYVHFNDFCKVIKLIEQIKSNSNYYNSENEALKEITVIINNSYISLAHNNMKPFADNDYTINSIDDILNAPVYLHDKIIKQLNNETSILYLLLSKMHNVNFIKPWNGMERTWANLCDILKNNVVYHMFEWKNKQIIAEEERRLKKEAAEKEKIQLIEKERRDAEEREKLVHTEETRIKAWEQWESRETQNKYTDNEMLGDLPEELKESLGINNKSDHAGNNINNETNTSNVKSRNKNENILKYIIILRIIGITMMLIASLLLILWTNLLNDNFDINTFTPYIYNGEIKNRAIIYKENNINSQFVRILINNKYDVNLFYFKEKISELKYKNHMNDKSLIWGDYLVNYKSHYGYIKKSDLANINYHGYVGLFICILSLTISILQLLYAIFRKTPIINLNMFLLFLFISYSFGTALIGIILLVPYIYLMKRFKKNYA